MLQVVSQIIIHLKQMSRQEQICEENFNKSNIENLCYTVDLDFPMQKDTIDCLIVLNGDTNTDQLNILCEASANIILADGGANTFYKLGLQDCPKIRAIVGDLDSIEETVKEFFIKRGVEVIEIQDQNYNDFEKSIMCAMRKGWRNLAAVGVFGSRMDHTLASFSITLRQNKLNPHLSLYLLSSSTLAYLIRPEKKYKIKLGKWISSKGCGLIPFGKVSFIQTTGFKWNLGNKQPFSSLEWGQFISSSNEFVEQQVTVFAQDQIFFTCSLENQTN